MQEQALWSLGKVPGETEQGTYARLRKITRRAVYCCFRVRYAGVRLGREEVTAASGGEDEVVGRRRSGRSVVESICGQREQLAELLLLRLCSYGRLPRACPPAHSSMLRTGGSCPLNSYPQAVT